MSTRLLLSALAALTLTSIGRAQTATPPAPEPTVSAATVAPAAAPAAPAVAAPAAVNREKDTLSVDFPDEDIKTILRNVADLFELNLVVPDTLVGKTSIKLRDVSWRQIFSVVLAPVNFTYVEDGNIIKIVSNDSLQQEPTSTDVFVLNYAKAADIKPTVDGLVDAASGGKILVDARSNALVVTERPSRMSRVRNIIEQLDKATDQVMIESKFIEVTDRDVRNVGVNWAGLQGFQLGATGMNQRYDKNSGNQLNTNNQNSNGTTAGNAVTYVTVPPIIGPNGQIATSTVSLPSGTVSGLPPTITSGTSLANYTPAVPGTPAVFDVNGNVLSAATPGSPATATALTTYNGGDTNALNTLSSLVGNNGTSRLTSALFSASDFNVVISALKSLNTVKVVSNPTVVTLNNTEATLNVGEEFPIPSYTYNSERGAFEVSGFAYKPIGVILKVTPQVNSRGTIKMSIEPEVSIRNGATTFGGAGGATIPIIATRKVKTQISLQSGYTAGIGGLITANKNNGTTKVPVLGDIPGLGRLFSSKSKDETTTNLLVFITARTVTADGASPEEMFDPRAIQGAGITREDLPGQRISKGGELYAKPEPASSGR